MYYRPDSNPPGAVAWRRTGGQGVWSTEQEVAMSLLQSFVIIDIIITIIIIIISIILIINTFISTELSIIIIGVDLTSGQGQRRHLHMYSAQQAWGVWTKGDPA